nr:transporter substrate-binding domain-containing protein [uncultured Desulfobulbus sp.]
MSIKIPSRPVHLQAWSRLLIGCLLTGLVAGCQAKRTDDQPSSLSEPQPLKVGISPDSPPLIMKKNGQVTGLELSFAQGLARSLNRPLQLVELPRQELVPALQAKRIDIIMSGMAAPTAQKQKLATTGPYLISGQIALVHLDDFSLLGTGRNHLTEKSIRLGVVKGSAGALLLEDLHPQGTVHDYANSLSGLQALIMDRIDVFISDLPTNNYYAAEFIEQGLTPGTTLFTREPLVWGVLPENTALLQAANGYLKKLQTEGHLKSLLSRWLPFYTNTAYSPRLHP